MTHRIYILYCRSCGNLLDDHTNEYRCSTCDDQYNFCVGCGHPIARDVYYHAPACKQKAYRSRENRKKRRMENQTPLHPRLDNKSLSNDTITLEALLSALQAGLGQTQGNTHKIASAPLNDSDIMDNIEVSRASNDGDATYNFMLSMYALDNSMSVDDLDVQVIRYALQHNKLRQADIERAKELTAAPKKMEVPETLPPPSFDDLDF